MTRNTKQELIAQIVAMLNAVIEVENEQQITEQKSSAPVEMLTVKECTWSNVNKVDNKKRRTK